MRSIPGTDSLSELCTFEVNLQQTDTVRDVCPQGPLCLSPEHVVRLDLVPVVAMTSVH